MDPDHMNNESRRGNEAGPRCPTCGKGEVRTDRTTETLVYGEGSDAVHLQVDIPVRTCRACGFRFTDDEAEDAHHEAICRHLGVLTPLDIRSLRKLYHLSRSEFARVTKLGEATLGRWERGALIQNTAYDQFLYLLGFEENWDRLRDRVEGRTGDVHALDAKGATPSFRAIKPTEKDYEEARAFKLTEAVR